jgi:hypothetical protein
MVTHGWDDLVELHQANYNYTFNPPKPLMRVKKDVKNKNNVIRFQVSTRVLVEELYSR